MLKCSNCDAFIDDKSTRHSGVEYNGEIVCVPCKEAIEFLSVDTKKYKEKKPEKKKTIISKSSYICMKCKNNYSGNKCPSCGLKNPLFR